MLRKRRSGAKLGFSNERFVKLLSDLSGVLPVGELGRETPLDLSGLEAARWSLLMREVYSKYDDGKPSEEKSTATWKKFYEAEQSCKETNVIIPKVFKYDPFWIAVKARVREVLRGFSWDEASKHFAFGPGSTTRLPRRNAAEAYKYSGIPECTTGNLTLAKTAIAVIPLWKRVVQSNGQGPDDLVKIVVGNKVIVVPKNYKSDRTIAKEPCMNIYIQKGIGRVIRYRLKSVGVDLNDQTLNQEAARKGSITGELATIDLSMASDTVAFELVSFLLPNDWWWALEQCRSPVGVLPSGQTLVYQKFSSMGNGYTFELESLIFWAICQQVCCSSTVETDSRVRVYGDDLVVPTDKAALLYSRLRQAGFEPNLKKSHVDGPYRESCGKHYFLGQDITPFYVRRPVETLDRLFLLHNNLYRFSERGELGLKEALTKLRELAPARWREPRLPDGFGDGAFIGSVDELRLDNHPFGWESWLVRVLAVSSRSLANELPEGQLIASLKRLATCVNSDIERELGFEEHPSGLPEMEGKYYERDLVIPRRARN